ncbi:MAG: hypothetical protein JSU68_06205 [Phycisphaerales bacterium]|nr:MAG: hypothetical protein JSU68_06205 [Phycisphaerales bacterium]
MKNRLASSRLQTFSRIAPPVLLTLLLIGCDNTSLPNTTPIPGGGAWRAFARPPVPFHEAGAVVLNNLLYYVGGRLPDGPIATLYSYDPSSDSWRDHSSHPGTPVDHMQAVAIGNYIYAIGGTTEFPGPSVTGTYRYDPATDSWITRANLPRSQGVMGCGVVNGKIYTIGGLSEGQAVDYVFEYDPVTDTWDDLTSVCPLPTARDHFVAATVNNRIHCIGGRVVDIYAVTNVHEVFDPQTRTWETKAPLPTARGGFSAAVLNGRILIMGGEGAGNSLGVFSENEEYNPATDTWRTLSPMTAPRHSAQAGVIGDVVYVAAGAPSIGRTYTDVHEGFSFAFE